MPTTQTALEKGVWGVAALQSSRQARRELQDGIAPRRDEWIKRNRYYYDCIKRLLRFMSSLASGFWKCVAKPVAF